MENQSKYNIELCKGTGLIQETLLLVDLYKTGLKKEEFAQQVIESNALVKASEKRINDIVKIVFYKRYIKYNPDVPLYLRQLKDKYISLDQLIQLFLVYTARANRIFFDFIIEVYWKKEKQLEKSSIKNEDVREFIKEAIKYGKIDHQWSEGTQARVASYIIAALIDFKFIDKKYNVSNIFLSDNVANYLAHELHFKGYSDEAIAIAEEWSLFGYNRYDTIRHLERLAIQGYFIFQNSGEFIRITWHYKNMKELIDAIR